MMNIFKRNLLGILLLATSIDAAASAKTNEEYYKKFQYVFEKVSNEYVEQPDKEKMLDAALSGMLSSLDPHSSYFTSEEFEDLVQSTKGEFGGIGVEILYESGAIKVVSPIDDLPAYKAGIKAGDYIIGINDDMVSNLGFSKSVKTMRGAPGTKVKLSVLTEGDNKARDLELTREIVKIKAIKSKLDGDVAYIRIVTFNEHTTSELKKAMADIIAAAKNPIKGIILDLRNNPGGLLKQATEVSDFFLDHGIIVSTRGREAKDSVSFSANKFTSKAPKVPVVVIINSGSASASEIVAGALQDHKRAIILGTKSFGKGSVQTLMELGNRTGMKLTTAKYYTPDGRSIQAEGITPDVQVEQAKIEYPKKDEGKKFSEASLKNYLKNDKSDKEKDKEKTQQVVSDMYKEDYQYSKAYDLIIGLSINSNYK
ncbi:MAG: S41 family peptidase [Rickettsiaceae bacterium]|nr:S41 family peptidase [Rickettsiaceae bacterium]